MTYVAQFLQYSNDMPAPDDHLQVGGRKLSEKGLFHLILCVSSVHSSINFVCSKPLFVPFYSGCSTIFLLAVPEQLFPLAPPSYVSPVSFSAHFTPAVAVSPLRQVPFLGRNNEMTKIESEFILVVYDCGDFRKPFHLTSRNVYF